MQTFNFRSHVCLTTSYSLEVDHMKLSTLMRANLSSVLKVWRGIISLNPVMFILGILITGGNMPGSLYSAEVFIPQLNGGPYSCSLPHWSEDYPKHGHMQFGTLICGGRTALVNGTCVE